VVVKTGSVTLGRYFTDNHLVDVAPDPVLSPLNRAHDWMMIVMKMFGGVLIFG
jgi:hypothetical protein